MLAFFSTRDAGMFPSEPGTPPSPTAVRTVQKEELPSGSLYPWALI